MKSVINGGEVDIPEDIRRRSGSRTSCRPLVSSRVYESRAMFQPVADGDLARSADHGGPVKLTGRLCPTGHGGLRLGVFGIRTSGIVLVPGMGSMSAAGRRRLSTLKSRTRGFLTFAWQGWMASGGRVERILSVSRPLRLVLPIFPFVRPPDRAAGWAIRTRKGRRLRLLAVRDRSPRSFTRETGGDHRLPKQVGDLRQN